MKNGLFFESDALIYYRDDVPYHAGVIKVDDAIYYIGSGGRAVKGVHVVHGEMANDILKRGTYTFGEDYKLVEGSYIAPKKHKRRKTGKLKKKLLNAVFVACIAIFAVILVQLSTLPAYLGKRSSATQSKIEVHMPVFDRDVLLCSPAAKSEYDGLLPLVNAVQAGNPYCPFWFQYQLADIPGILLISENSTYENARVYDLPVDKTSIAIDNLKTGTAYYYKAIVGDKEYPGSFRTAVSTRFVSFPGLLNTRDIGGYTTLDGKHVRQGLLIRGTELDGLVNPTYFLADEHIATVKDTFGFVYEMDLRDPAIYAGSYRSRLGITHKFYNAPAYGAIFNSASHEALRQIFSDLAKPQNYPMYLHCTWGTDRTGCIVFFLQGVLNMSEEDMLREYELTGYCSPDFVGSKNMQVVISHLQTYEGNTLQEKIVTYLTTVVGVSEAEITAIRNIYLEG